MRGRPCITLSMCAEHNWLWEDLHVSPCLCVQGTIVHERTSIYHLVYVCRAQLTMRGRPCITLSMCAEHNWQWEDLHVSPCLCVQGTIVYERTSIYHLVYVCRAQLTTRGPPYITLSMCAEHKWLQEDLHVLPCLCVQGTIDYERTSMYHLIVVASDRGPDSRAAETTVIVLVDDLNDNAPTVVVNTLNAVLGSLTAVVMEDAPIGTFVAHVTASDVDSGPNGRVECTINTNIFVLQQKYSSEYQVSPLTIPYQLRCNFHSMSLFANSFCVIRC